MRQEYTAAMAHAAVARGAAWLDKRCPTWADEIDLAILDLGSCDHCILGQTATCLLPPEDEDVECNYVDVLYHFAPTAEVAWARRYGFEAPTAEPESGTRYEMLTIAWKELIRQRREQAAP